MGRDMQQGGILSLRVSTIFTIFGYILQHCSRLLVPATNLSLDWTAVMNFFHLLLNSIIWKGIQCTLHAPYSKPIMILGLEIYTFEDTGHGHTWAKDIYRSRF